jgi:hypothetical protein
MRAWRTYWAAVTVIAALGSLAACQDKVDGPMGPIDPRFAHGVPGPPNGGGGGGGEETAGNNLSYPVVFAEGVGLKGLAASDIDGHPIFANTGLRPTDADPEALAELMTAGIPFFYSGNVADYGDYFMQQGENVWQAEWLDGVTGGVREAMVDWGDNLTHQTWSVQSVIRIEHTLYDQSSPLSGFDMTYLFGEGPSEMQGTTGTAAYNAPTVYSVTPRLIIQKLDGEGGTPVQTIFDGKLADGFGQDGPGFYSAEVNVGGKVVYGYNLMMRQVKMEPSVPKDGWWRITFQLEPSASVLGSVYTRNVMLVGMVDDPVGEDLTYVPVWSTYGTSLDFLLRSNRGGGKKPTNPGN